MLKAVVVGGSNGIGLAITEQLIADGYYVYILDKSRPDREIKENGSYIYCNLLELDESAIEKLAEDKEIKFLMLTAGFGYVTGFENLHNAEIDNLLTVNTTATIKIIKMFYERIKGEEDFYCAFMGSIAGLVSSPLFSVYAASKAALCRFAESVNIELEKSGCKNRILNVSPGSLKGTRFNGGENDLSQTADIARNIVNNAYKRETLFIPEYDGVYKRVIENYKNDAHSFATDSYDYKVNSGRVEQKSRVCIGYLSGTFDLFHIGHLNLLRRAKKQCDYLIVGVHPDASHKGKETFIPYEERLEIVSSIKYVDKAVMSVPEDSDAWNKWHFSKLFVGSDYKGSERFKRYEEFFKDKNVEIVYFPYTKGTSSTQLREKLSK